MNYLSILSYIMGWTYFIAWSISFYPFLYENHKLKNVNGVSINYIALNLTGFICLGVYSSFGFWYPQYDLGEVRIEDLAFAYHAVIITFFIIY